LRLLRNKKQAAYYLFSVFCLLLVTSTVFAQQFAPDIQRIIDKKMIIIAMLEKDQPPFFMKNEDDSLVGFDVELARGIAKELGVKAVFNRTSKTFDGTVDLVVNRQADIAISKLSITLSRAQKVLFTHPYVVLRKALLINQLNFAKAVKGQDQIDFIKNLRGDLGVLAASSYVGFAKKMFPHVEIHEFKQWEDLVTAVEKGEILAVFRDELEIKKVVRNNHYSVLKLQTVAFKDTKDPIAMAVSPDCRHLLFWLNLYLDSLNMDMDADKLLDKYYE